MIEYMIEVTSTMTLDQIINGIKNCIITYEEEDDDDDYDQYEKNINQMLTYCHFFILKLSSESLEGGAPELIRRIKETRKMKK